MIVGIKYFKKNPPRAFESATGHYRVIEILGKLMVNIQFTYNWHQFTIPEFVTWIHKQHPIASMWLEIENGEQVNIFVDPMTKELDKQSLEIINSYTLKRPTMTIENIEIPSTPISPDDIKKLQESGALIPPFVIKAVNRLLIENATVSGTSITLKLDDVKRAINAEKRGITDKFDNNWLDFELYFRKHGWGVEYDQPGYNESYPATYTFKMKR